jgi:hypothetical protein
VGGEEGGEEAGRWAGLDPLVVGGGEEQRVGGEGAGGGLSLLHAPWELHRLDWLAIICKQHVSVIVAYKDLSIYSSMKKTCTSIPF